MTDMTREYWMERAVAMLGQRWLKPHNMLMPKMQFAVGFRPSNVQKAYGFCMSRSVSAAVISHVFICPWVDSPTAVMDTLCHELVHAMIDEPGHKKAFREACELLGLVFDKDAPGDARFMRPGEELIRVYSDILEELPAWPHAAVIIPPKPKKPSNELVFVSINIENYKVRISKKNAEEHGIPRDPEGDEMELLEA